MSPEKFFEKISAINIPLTEKEWKLLLDLFEENSPGITSYVPPETNITKNHFHNDEKTNKNFQSCLDENIGCCEACPRLSKEMLKKIRAEKYPLII